MALGDKKLVVQRASVGAKLIEEYATTDMTSMAMPINIPGLQMPSTAQTATTVLCLMNMTTEEDLRDDDEYEGNGNDYELRQPTVTVTQISLLNLWVVVDSKVIPN